MKMKTKIIGYFGGKGGNLSTVIKTFIPKNYEIYVEPYGGSASTLFTQNAPIEIYNDIYENVYSLFKVMSDESLFKQLKEKLDVTPYSEKINKEFKQNLKRNDLSLLDRAYYYFYVNRTSVNAIGGFSINTVIRRNISKSTSDYLSAIDGLEEYNKRLSNVIVTNKNAIDVIKKYDRESTFIYLDPPYPHITRTNARYDCDMTDEQHIELLNTIINCKSKILISTYDNEMYNILTENGWNKYSFDIKTTDGKNRAKTKTETLYYNYTL